MLRLAGLRRHGAAALRQLLPPLVAGHAACVAPIVATATLGVTIDRALAPTLAAVLLVVAVAVRPQRLRPGGAALARRGCQAGLALGSFWVASAHGAGLMLVPVLAPLCGP